MGEKVLRRQLELINASPEWVWRWRPGFCTCPRKGQEAEVGREKYTLNSCRIQNYLG
jgi:hypothetical protein